jgi:hypothetical protein
MAGADIAAFTVKNAGLLVTEPKLLLRVTVNSEPLSETVVTGIE